MPLVPTRTGEAPLLAAHSGGVSSQKMRIFNSPTGDPMLLGTESQLRALHARFDAFTKSSEVDATFTAETSGSPSPYSEFLCGIRVAKTIGEPRLSISSDRWLELSASQEDVCRFKDMLLVKESDGHTHWYCKPVSLIIEADSTWPCHHES